MAELPAAPGPSRSGTSRSAITNATEPRAAAASTSRSRSGPPWGSSARAEPESRPWSTSCSACALPTSGTILIDGTPLPDVIHAWRSRIGYVPQRVTLFDGTIGQNVALTWDDDYDRDKVIEVLEKAQLSSLIESRGHGIDERIGERGVTLSGGQQQRLGIARALYSDPLVLVLDEATSSLDTKTEDDVVRAMKALHGEMTLIAVAHRISTIKDYDQICYLDRGRILGKGTFQELAASVPQFGLQVKLAGVSDVDPDDVLTA